MVNFITSQPGGASLLKQSAGCRRRKVRVKQLMILWGDNSEITIFVWNMKHHEMPRTK